MCSALYDLSERIEHFMNQRFDLFYFNRARMLPGCSIQQVYALNIAEVIWLSTGKSPITLTSHAKNLPLL